MTFVLATRNRHKAAEIRAMLGDACRLFTLDDFPEAPAVVEDAPTFAGNALKKARALAEWLEADPAAKRRLSDAQSIWALADDSGLEVDALNGAPGVHSARFAASLSPERTGNTPDTENNAKLLRLLEGVPPEKRSGRFRCVLALTRLRPATAAPGTMSDPVTEIFEGHCEGRIGDQAKGSRGFGYDPLFTPDGYHQSFGELEESIKNQLSHRGRALQALKAWLGTWHAPKGTKTSNPIPT